MLDAPFAHHIGQVRDPPPRMNESPTACRATWLASDIIPASATTVTSVRLWAVLKLLTTGTMVAVSALLPSNAATFNGKPVASVNSPRVIWGSRKPSGRAMVRKPPR